MERQDLPRFVAASQPRAKPWLPVVALCLVGLAMLAGCSSTEPNRGPQLVPRDTPAPLPTATSTPVLTATPVPAPTPVAALPAGVLPTGEVFFSTRRSGEAWEELWQVDAVHGLRLAQSAVAPGLWQCASEDNALCAFVTSQGALQVSWPASGTLVLLDDLTALVASGGTGTVGPTGSASPTVALSDTAIFSQTLVVTGTRFLTLPLPMLQLTLAPNAEALAVSGQDGVKVYDLATQSLEAHLQVTGTTALAWSPDSTALGLAYTADDGASSLALWNWPAREVRTLASTRDVGDLAWAPDGTKLAFTARPQSLTLDSQGGQSDVFVVSLETGEIANLTEVFLRNDGVAPAQQIAAWAPGWEAASSTVRYVLGVPGQPDQQSIVRHPLLSQGLKGLEPVKEAGAAGIVRGPDGKLDARVDARAGRQVVQLRSGDGGWRDASPGTFEGLHGLVWAPIDSLPAGSDEVTQGGYLLLVSKQALFVLDVSSGQVGGLAVACPSCTVERAVWLP